MRLKRVREEMHLAKEQDQLIEKELALKQLTYLMIVMRQKALGASALNQQSVTVSCRSGK